MALYFGNTDLPLFSLSGPALEEFHQFHHRDHQHGQGQGDTVFGPTHGGEAEGSAMGPTSKTSVVMRRLPSIATHRTLLWLRLEKMLRR